MKKVFVFTFVYLLSASFVSIQEVNIKNDIQYGEAVNDKHITQPLLMDLYFIGQLPKQKSPAIIFVHGGGFKTGDKQQDMYIKMCRKFAKVGYVSFSINYRLSTQEKITLPILDNAVNDVLTAIKWIQVHCDEYGIDSKKMIVVGDSAGGGIVVNAAYSDEGKKWIAACIDLWGGLPFSQNEPDINKYGQPVNYHPVQTDIPPTCIFHSREDDIIPVSTSLNLSDELKSKGIEHEIHILDSADHYPENMAKQFIPIMIDFVGRIVCNSYVYQE